MPIKAFNDIPRRSLPQREGVGGFDDLRRVATLQVGVGTRAFKADESGAWLGAHKWADAPFRVDMQGRVYLESDNGQLRLDAVNNRFLVYDAESVPIIVIGYVA